MTNESLVSVIVPAYNHEKFIENALRSLIAQTYPHLEIIVMDDGSTDATFRRIQEMKSELERRFVRVDIATKENEGGAKTISCCLDSARGDLVYMLDSDDVAHPDAIERLMDFMAHPDAALAVGDNEFVDAEGRTMILEVNGDRRRTLLEYHTKDRPDFSVERDFGSFASLILGNYVPNGWLLRRSCVREVGGYAVDLMLDDWPLLLRLSKKYRIRYAGAVLGKYRLHGRNSTALHEDRLNLETAQVLLQERTYCRQHGFEREWWSYSTSVLDGLRDDQILDLIRRSKSVENWWKDKYPRIADIVRTAGRENS